MLPESLQPGRGWQECVQIANMLNIPSPFLIFSDLSGYIQNVKASHEMGIIETCFARVNTRAKQS